MLVTGGTGFTGSHTAAELMTAGHDVRVMVRDLAKVQRVFEPLGAVPTDVVLGDVTDEGAVDAALTGCDGVVHTAALVDVSRAHGRQVETTNTRGTELVIGGAVARGMPAIVYVSSTSVFLRPGGPVMTPSSPLADGRSTYARSKVHAERFVRRLQDDGAPICTTYPAAISGPDDPGPSVVNAGLASFLSGLFIITSGGLQIVDVRDLAALHRVLLDAPPAPRRYAAASDMLSWQQIYDVCSALTGTHPRHVRLPGAVLRGAGTLGDVVKRLRDFDFPMTREAMETSTRWPGVDAGATTRDLGVHFRAPADTLRDTLIGLYTAGHLTAAQVGRLAGEAVPP